MKNTNMFGPEPIKLKRRTNPYELLALGITLCFIGYAIAVVLYVYGLTTEINSLKREVVQQNIRAHQALNDRDSFAEQLKTCQAK